MSSNYTTPGAVRLALVPSSAGAVPATPSNTAADLSDAQLQDSIDEAAAQIDSYIGRGYAVPVVQVGGVTPHPIDFWCRNIAAYNATLAYRGSMDFTDEDPVARRWRATMDALTMVANGKVDLQLPRGVGDGGTSGADAPYNPYGGVLWDVTDFSLNPGHAMSGRSGWGPYW